MRFVASRIMALAMLLSAAAPLSAADMLDVVPDNALAVLVINRLEATSDRLAKIAAKLQAPPVSLLALARTQTGVQEGLDEKGTALAAALPGGPVGAPPDVILFLPVTDYAKLIAQLQPSDAGDGISEVVVTGQSALVGQRGDFACFVAQNKKQVLKDVMASTKSVADSLAPLRNWLGEMEIALVVPPAGIQLGVQSSLQPLTQAKAMVAQIGGPQQKQILSTIDNVESFLRTASSEVTHLCVGIHTDEPGNLRVTSQLRFDEGGQWSATARGFKAPKQGVLVGLPEKPFAFTMGMMLPKPWRDAMIVWVKKVSELNPALAKLSTSERSAVEKSMTDMMLPMDSMGIWMGPTEKGEPSLAHTVAVLKVDDTKKYLDLYEKSLKTMTKFAAGPEMPNITYEVKRIDVDGGQVLDVLMDFSEIDEVEFDQVKSLFQSMYGSSDKVHVYLGALDAKTLVMGYLTLENYKMAALAARQPGGGPLELAEVGPTSALLPSGAQWLMLVQPQTLVGFAEKMAAQAPQLQLPAELPVVSPAPPIGVAVELSTTGIQKDVVIPSATLEAIGKWVKELQSARGEN